MVQEQQSRGSDDHAETDFEMKQSTMPDQSMQIDQTFANVRPALVVSEGETDGGLSDEVIAQYTFGALSDLKVQMSNTFEDQFVSKYLPRIFPWCLKYDSGGPEYPKLFSDWSALDSCGNPNANIAVEARWRRHTEAAVVTPGLYAQMLSTRSECQVGGDWMMVPGARNLHWRYSVLHSAFLSCKQKVAPGEPLVSNLSNTNMEIIYTI